jgi:hypothetical protein
MDPLILAFRLSEIPGKITSDAQDPNVLNSLTVKLANFFRTHDLQIEKVRISGKQARIVFIPKDHYVLEFRVKESEGYIRPVPAVHPSHEQSDKTSIESLENILFDP